MQGPTSRITGIGLGLRAPLAEHIVSRAPASLRWLEVSPENYVGRAGAFVRHLDAARERFPLVTHGLTLCPGGADALDDAYLRDLDGFLRRVETPWHSDHLCFGSDEGVFLHDLLPLPFTRASAEHTARRIVEAQQRLSVPFALENISWYAHPGEAELDEAAFITEVLARSGAGLLLDVNNVYVNARNHGFDARAMIDRLPLDRVVQLHVAGHFTGHDGLRIDTHGEAVCDDVYGLLEYTLTKTGAVPVLLERDQNFPSWEAIVGELDRLDTLWRRATGATP
jgi:uncharacterized protein